MKKKNLMAAIFLAFFCVFSAVTEASSKPSGAALTQAIHKILSDRNFTVYRQELTSTGQDSFAENLYIEFAGEKKPETSEENPAGAEEFRTNLVFDFTQEDFYAHQAEFILFLSEVSEMKLHVNLTVLFSALAKPELPAFSAVSGTKTYAGNIGDIDSICAVTIDLDDSERNTIYTGTLYSTSPLWLCKNTAEAFTASHTDFRFPNVISSVYRLGLVHGEKRMSEYMQAEIPAISIHLNSCRDFPVLKNFLELFDSSKTLEWDQHYFFIPAGFPLRPFFLGERFCLIFCMVLAILALFLLCTFSFTGKSGEQNKYDLIKNLYVIPLTLAVSLLGLILAQKAVSSFTKDFFINPVTVFGVKVIFSMLLISFFFGLHNFLKIPTDIFIYSYIIQFIAILNIFIFSSSDLMLFIPFVVEYLIIYFSRKAKKLSVLIIDLILMTLPFLPYAVSILPNPMTIDLRSSIFTNFFGNLMLSLALFPFQILWLKILVRLELYSKDRGFSIKRMVLNGTVSTFSILSFVFLLMLLVSNLLFKPSEKKNEAERFSIEDGKNEFCSLKISQNKFSGMSTTHIKIHSKEPALRYIVTVTGNDSKLPVLDSIYDYEINETREKEDRVRFIVPDYPPQDITIDYASEISSQARIDVVAFYKTENDKVFRREQIFTEIGAQK